MADIVWATTRLPDAIVGVPFEASLAVTGNATAFTAVAVNSGALPASGHLVFSAERVRITGTPTKVDVGTYTFTVSLTDTAGAVVSPSFTVNVRYHTEADTVTLVNLGQKAAADAARLWPT
jgi:hypothetical protein